MTNAAAEVMIAPTRERLRHAQGSTIDEPVVDQKIARQAWRIVGVVEAMHRAGKLDDRRWEAWERFERDWDRAAIQPSIIARYGERAGTGRVPVSQMTADAVRGVEVNDLRRSDAIERVQDGLLSLKLPRLQQAIVMAASEQCNLEMIGARIARHKSPKVRQAIAGVAIEDGLWLLHTYYARLYGQAQVAP
jgi:hypothetical protein